MRSIKSALFHGFLVWLIPFIFGFLLFPIHESDRILFESIMPVVVTISAVLFTFLYLKKQKSNYFKEGILLGITFIIHVGTYENDIFSLYVRYWINLSYYPNNNNRYWGFN